MAHNHFDVGMASTHAVKSPRHLSLRDVFYIFGTGWCVPYAAFFGLAVGLLYLAQLYPHVLADSQLVNWLYGESYGLTWFDYLFVSFVIAAEMAAIYYFAIKRKRLEWAQLGICQANTKWYVFATVLFFIIEGTTSLTVLVAGLEQEAYQFARRILLPESKSLILLVFSLILFGPLVAFVEESFFRGIIYRWFRSRFGIVAGLFINTILFGAVHFYYLDPGGNLGWIITGNVLAYGLATALLFEGSKSLWPGIFLHATTNMVTTTVVFIS